MPDESLIRESAQHREGWARPIPRRASIMLRNQRLFEADIYAHEGEFLPRLLASRKNFVNFTSVRWMTQQAVLVPHVAVRLDRILWVRSLSPELPLTSQMSSPRQRTVRIHLEDGMVLRAQLPVSPEHRISDYFDNANAFLPAFHVQSAATQELVGDIALNQEAIVAVTEEAG
jgi:hypothetical protein